MFSSIKVIAFYAIYAAIWIILFMSLTGKVKYGLFLLVPLMPLQNIVIKLHQLPVGKDLNDLLILGMIVGWVINKSSTGKPLIERTSYNKILLLYLIFTYFALWRGTFFLGAPNPTSIFDPRVQTWKNYTILPLLFILTFNNIEDKKQMRLLLIFMCLSMFLMNFYTLRQLSWMTAWWSRTKIKGTFYWLGANEIAAFYATYTFVLVGLFLFIKDKRWKIVLGILIFQNIYCDLFLFSRGAYLATITGFLLIGLLKERKLIPLVAAALIFWHILLPPMVVERIEASTEETGELDPSAASRLEYWQQNIEYFKASPIIGVGFNTVTKLGAKRDTHNVYIRTLAEEGIIGISFLLLIMGLAFKRSLLLFRRADDRFLKGLGLGFCACVVAVMVGNLFGDRWTYLPLGTYFWVFLGMVERGNLITKKEANESVNSQQSTVHGNRDKEKIDKVYGKKDSR